MVILSPTQGSHSHNSYTMSFLVSNFTGIVLYYIIPWPQKLYFRFVVCPEGTSQEVNVLVFSFTAAMTSQEMSCQSHVQAVFQSQLPSSFHPLSKVCGCSKTEKSWVAEYRFLCACATKRNGLLSQLKSLDAVLDHKMFLDLGPKQIAAYTKL